MQKKIWKCIFLCWIFNDLTIDHIQKFWSGSVSREAEIFADENNNKEKS